MRTFCFTGGDGAFPARQEIAVGSPHPSSCWLESEVTKINAHETRGNMSKYMLVLPSNRPNNSRISGQRCTQPEKSPIILTFCFILRCRNSGWSWPEVITCTVCECLLPWTSCRRIYILDRSSKMKMHGMTGSPNSPPPQFCNSQVTNNQTGLWYFMTHQRY